jgi:hypothetical protein
MLGRSAVSGGSRSGCLGQDVWREQCSGVQSRGECSALVIGAHSTPVHQGASGTALREEVERVGRVERWRGLMFRFRLLAWRRSSWW